MIEQYILQMPQKVYSGKDALKNIKAITQGKQEIAIFTDKGIAEAGLLDYVLKYLEDKEVLLFDELPTEPNCDEVQSIIDKVKKSKFQMILAVGGGSVMDIAKLVSVLLKSEYTVRNLLEDSSLMKKGIETLMIPTTAGTGSEATPNSIVTVPENNLKVGIVGTQMIADYVILDAIMIKKLPLKIAAATGVDAMAHAIECITSKKSNPFSDLFAFEAMDLIINNIVNACKDPSAMDAKNAMLLAAFYGGVAITASGTTAVHALSYPLGGKYHIPHGISNAMMLIPVMKFNEPACKDRFAKVYDRVNRNKLHHISEEEKSQWVINKMEEIVNNLEIPTSLSAYGIGKEDLSELVASGMKVTRLLVNNMREIKEEDARDLYLQIM